MPVTIVPKKADAARPIHCVARDRLAESGAGAAALAWAKANRFAGEAGKVLLVPGPDGDVSAAFFGVECELWSGGILRLPSPLPVMERCWQGCVQVWRMLVLRLLQVDLSESGQIARIVPWRDTDYKSTSGTRWVRVVQTGVALYNLVDFSGTRRVSWSLICL